MRCVRAVLVLALAIVPARAPAVKYQLSFASASPAGASTIGVARDSVRVESSAGRLR
jgi:hypothetical protein